MDLVFVFLGAMFFVLSIACVWRVFPRARP